MEKEITQSGIKLALKDAFLTVIYDREYYAGQDQKGKDRIRNYRRFIKKDLVTKDQMERVIKDYGFVLIQESTWKLNLEHA